MVILSPNFLAFDSGASPTPSADVAVAGVRGARHRDRKAVCVPNSARSPNFRILDANFFNKGVHAIIKMDKTNRASSDYRLYI